MSKSIYEQENRLLPHYEKHLKYYSPIKSEKYFDYMKKITDLNVDDSHCILDLGCGDGTLAQYIGDARYIGVDYSPSRIELAQKRNTHKTNTTFINSCARKYVMSSSEQFDLIFAFEFLEHIVNPKGLIDCIINVQKKCLMIATVPVNMPRPVHLSVWKTEQDVQQSLNPDMVQLDNTKKHFICMWKSR